MDRMKHVCLCLIMGMMSYNSNNNNVLTVMPEEVLQRIAGFIEGEESGAMCNAFGKQAEAYDSFQCYRCKRMMPYRDVEPYMGILICADHEGDECERIWEEGWGRDQADPTCEEPSYNHIDSDIDSDNDSDADEDSDIDEDSGNDEDNDSDEDSDN